MQLFEISYAYKFLGGFYLAMAVLHLILYFYKIARRVNLIYAVGMLMVFINFTFTHNAIHDSGAHKLNVLGGIPIYHSQDKKEVCYIGKDKTSGFDRITLIYTGDFKQSRKITGIFNRITKWDFHFNET